MVNAEEEIFFRTGVLSHLESFVAKIKLNVLVDPSVAEQFREQAAHFDNRLGDCLTAAMLLWLETAPDTQGQLLKRLHDAQVDKGVASLVEEALARQSRGVRKRRSGK